MWRTTGCPRNREGLGPIRPGFSLKSVANVVLKIQCNSACRICQEAWLDFLEKSRKMKTEVS